MQDKRKTNINQTLLLIFGNILHFTKNSCPFQSSYKVKY